MLYEENYAIFIHMNKEVGKYISQKGGFKAFVPNEFPSKKLLSFDQSILKKSEEARSLLCFLDGIAYNLPDVDFFIFMHIRKESTASSQIEGTNADIDDVLDSETKEVSQKDLPEDVDDITHYINALNEGLRALSDRAIGENLIKDMHKKLMSGARTTIPNNTPGEFRNTQNWINGRNISEARFVPAPVSEISRSMSDLEKFIYSKNTSLFPIIQVALVHAQFEVIHPFLDGNGRTGRMLITLFLSEKKIITKPLLYLSSYFREHREAYMDKLHGYSKGEVDEWVDFFLDAVIDVAKESAVIL